MSKPTGDSLHPGKGFWGNCPRPTLPAILGALLLAVCLALLSVASEATANPAPRLIPSAAGTSGGDAPPAVLSGLVVTGEPSPTGRWIVAGRPGRLTDARAKRFGAAAITRPLGIYALDEESATGFIISLRRVGTYRFSEPDVRTISDEPAPEESPVNREGPGWWLSQIDRPNVPPKKIDRNSPTLALLEQSLDPKHPDLAGLEARDRLLDPFSLGDLTDARGTAMTALAASLAGEKDGRTTGVWPGMRVRLVRHQETCESKTRAVYRAARSGRNEVLAMGYAFPGDQCFAHYLATEYAVYRGIVPVAAAGNQDSSIAGSVPPRPASDPHVLTVTASDQERAVWDGAVSGPWVDLVAPGVALEVPWLSPGGEGEPLRRDWTPRSGTEYSTAIVAAAAAWILQARPTLEARQVIRLLTNAATPLGESGRSQLSGHGLLNLSRALREGAPIDDPHEPNDDIGWVRADSLLVDSEGGQPIKRKVFWQSGDRTKKVTATLGRVKDPADVYRIQVGPKAKLRIKVSQFAGNSKLTVVRSDASSIKSLEAGQVVAASDRPPGKKADAVEITNPSDLWLTAFVAIEVSAQQSRGRENATYRLAVESRP